MLDNNTNKIVWIGVAIGIVAVVGFGTMQMFPGVMDTGKHQVATLADGFANVDTSFNYKKSQVMMRADAKELFDWSADDKTKQSQKYTDLFDIAIGGVLGDNSVGYDAKNGKIYGAIRGNSIHPLSDYPALEKVSTYGKDGYLLYVSYVIDGKGNVIYSAGKSEPGTTLDLSKLSDSEQYSVIAPVVSGGQLNEEGNKYSFPTDVYLEMVNARMSGKELKAQLSDEWGQLYPGLPVGVGHDSVPFSEFEEMYYGDFSDKEKAQVRKYSYMTWLAWGYADSVSEIKDAMSKI